MSMRPCPPPVFLCLRFEAASRRQVEPLSGADEAASWIGRSPGLHLQRLLHWVTGDGVLALSSWIFFGRCLEVDRMRWVGYGGLKDGEEE
jgi:hypothetical protein